MTKDNAATTQMRMAADSPLPCSKFWIADLPITLLEKICDEGQPAISWLCAVCGEWHDNCPKKEALPEGEAMIDSGGK